MFKALITSKEFGITKGKIYSSQYQWPTCVSIYTEHKVMFFSTDINSKTYPFVGEYFDQIG